MIDISFLFLPPYCSVDIEVAKLCSKPGGNCAKYFRFASRPFYVTCSRQPSEKKIQCKILSSLLKDSISDFAQPSVWTWGPHFKIKWNKQIHTIEVLIQSFFILSSFSGMCMLQWFCILNHLVLLSTLKCYADMSHSFLQLCAKHGISFTDFCVESSSTICCLYGDFC